MVDRRLRWLAGIVLVWGAVIFLKLVSLQVIHHREYVRLARARQEMVIEIPAPRGTVFDRTGRPLAMSVPTESVYINPLKVPDLEVAAELLARALHMDRPELYGAHEGAYENHRGFLWVKRKITYEEGQELRSMHLEWIAIQKREPAPLSQWHPGGARARVGGFRGEGQRRHREGAGHASCAARPGEMRLLTDVKRRGIESQLDTEARPGTPLTLTIDERMQFVAERELAAAVAAHARRQRQRGGDESSTRRDAGAGQLPHVRSQPAARTRRESRARQNHAISVPFEPGSVFKVITLSAALETTDLTPGEPDRLPRRRAHAARARHPRFARRHRDHSHGEVLAQSSNIGAIQIGMHVGQQNMYEYVRRFGFGQKTGIELPAESRGKVRKLAQWGTTSLASVAMGQEVSVTTLQLAQAGSVIANGGLLVRPRLVLKKGGQAVPVAAAGAHHEAGDRHHHAADDGRRGARPARHRKKGASWKDTRSAGRPGRRRSSTSPPNTIPTPTTGRSWASRR